MEEGKGSFVVCFSFHPFRLVHSFATLVSPFAFVVESFLQWRICTFPIKIQQEYSIRDISKPKPFLRKLLLIPTSRSSHCYHHPPLSPSLQTPLSVLGPATHSETYIRSQPYSSSPSTIPPHSPHSLPYPQLSQLPHSHESPHPLH